VAPSTRTIQPAKALATLRGITIRQLAFDLGYSAQHLGRVLLGHERPSAELSARLAEYFGEAADALFVTDDDDAARVVHELIARTVAASGVPTRVEDPAAVERVADILRAAP
jgi:transcriptional regulator with XRE-family HTH domain